MTRHAPDPAAIASLASACVRCGLCLPHCPTYALDQVESESPRGRIALAQALASGQPLEDSLAGHLDHCLACGRCQQVCPAKVRYGELLDQTRALQRGARSIGLRQRLVESLCARPRLLQALLRVYRLAFAALPRSLRPLPRPPAAKGAALAADKQTGPALFLGCIGRSYESPAVSALARLLQALGQGLQLPEGQGCCGALHQHAGDRARAAALAAANRSAFADQDTVLGLASGCLGSLQASLDGPNRAMDALAYLAAEGAALRFSPTPETIALHRPCTQDEAGWRGLRELLARVPQLRVVELDPGHGCCGAAGSHMLDFPERAARLRQPLLDQTRASDAITVLSANIGCRLHLGHAGLAVLHPLEFLAARLDIEATAAALSSAP
jgi:glycolate oxidase iron-sulfur subunit